MIDRTRLSAPGGNSAGHVVSVASSAADPLASRPAGAAEVSDRHARTWSSRSMARGGSSPGAEALSYSATTAPPRLRKYVSRPATSASVNVSGAATMITANRASAPGSDTLAGDSEIVAAAAGDVSVRDVSANLGSSSRTRPTNVDIHD